MKTRILSAIVMIILVGAFLVLGFTISPLFLTAFLSVAAAIGAYELLKNAAGITRKTAYIGGAVSAAVTVILSDNTVSGYYKNFSKAGCPVYLFAAVLYFIFAVAIILINHKEFDLSRIFVFVAGPNILGYGFSCMGNMVGGNNGIYYLLLLVTFSCICDSGAYFTGVAIGKHKLCPEISPKKTVEGAIGGIVSALIFSVIILIVFNKISPIPTVKIVTTVILTVPFCILGMMGDLFASAIKRSVNLKDYGNLIPGHGGVLDRFDSILLISPLLYILSVYGVI